MTRSMAANVIHEKGGEHCPELSEKAIPQIRVIMVTYETNTRTCTHAHKKACRRLIQGSSTTSRTSFHLWILRPLVAVARWTREERTAFTKVTSPYVRNHCTVRIITETQGFLKSPSLLRPSAEQLTGKRFELLYYCTQHFKSFEYQNGHLSLHLEVVCSN